MPSKRLDLPRPSHVELGSKVETTEFMEDSYYLGDVLAFEECWPNRGKIRKADRVYDDIVGVVRLVDHSKMQMTYWPIFSPTRIKWCTFYVVKCADGTLYAGISNDPVRRLMQHAKGRGAKYMRPKCRWPAVLIYRERFCSRAAAAQRECWFKKLTKRKKLEVIAADPRTLLEAFYQTA